LAEFPVTEDQRARLRRLLFLEPLPFVRRVIFISTPHRGSYRLSSFARELGDKLMSLPRTTVNATRDAANFVKGASAQRLLRGHLPSSLDSMSPKNPGLLALADIPVSPSITAHSIISIQGDDQPRKGGDGVVKYTSAHVDYAESEFIVRSFHTCLNQPSTIQEVRRILNEHLRGDRAWFPDKPPSPPVR